MSTTTPEIIAKPTSDTATEVEVTQKVAQPKPEVTSGDSTAADASEFSALVRKSPNLYFTLMFLIFPDTAMKKAAKKRVLDSLPSTSVDRNFITAIRAMSEFMLKPSDLEGLRKTRRRSPFELEPPIVVFWRKDVEQRALDVWGDWNQLEAERMKRSRDYALRKKSKTR
jgi:hypothetical protein